MSVVNASGGCSASSSKPVTVWLENWRLVSVLSPVTTNQLAGAVISDTIQRDKVFRDNRRTLSARVVFDGNRLILKVSRARNRRRWERFLTRFRGSDAVRTFHHLRLAGQLDFHAPDPVLAGEKMCGGVVVDSFLIYQYSEGRPASEEDSLAVLNSLRALHSKGYVRNDAQLANFLIGEDGEVVFIDFRLRRPRCLPALQKFRELDRFLRSCPSAELHLTRAETSSAWFRLARVLENFSFARRRWKRYVRRRRNA